LINGTTGPEPTVLTQVPTVLGLKRTSWRSSCRQIRKIGRPSSNFEVTTCARSEALALDFGRMVLTAAATVTP
jgi:hypothetical protein